jgi:zinc protease
MRVVVHEDRIRPDGRRHLMYHVGSKDERPGRTGLAHLLEHLLFEGSEHCAQGPVRPLLEQVGGTNNGSTWLDRTNYYETVPTHAVELPLWLERERMAFFLPVLDEEMLELQRGVVINERRQATRTAPTAWPTSACTSCSSRRAPVLLADHRLHADLERSRWTTRATSYGLLHPAQRGAGARRRRRRRTRPSELAERYFGDLPAGPALPAGSPRAPPVPGRRARGDGGPGHLPRVYRAHAGPAYGTADWVALDVLAYLLADGESSRLQRALVRERQLAQDVDTYLYPTELCADLRRRRHGAVRRAPEELEGAIDA